MYLSRMTLELRDPSVRQALRNCEDMHRNLMCAFLSAQTDGAARKSANILYRLKESRNELVLLMSSDIIPDRGALARNGFILSPNAPKDISALKERFLTGMHLQFELLAAPCKKLCGEQKNSRRVFLKTEEARADWLVRQGVKYGFVPKSFQEDAQTVPVDGDKKGMHIHYDAVRFHGILQITDADLFWSAYCQGIGPGKAYGLGMLTVARV